MRIMAMFPPEEQDVVRIRMAESLHAVISQRLLPRKDGQGRVAALEIMMVTPTIRDLILDRDRIGEIREFIAEGHEQYGMQTFDQHLEQLVTDGIVEFNVALAASTRPSDFQLRMQMFKRPSSAMSEPAPDPDSGPSARDSAFDSGMEFLNG
jgi:twitching motility protein PilT